LDCVDIMEAIGGIPGVKLDQRDNHGKTAIDIAFACQSKNVGRFLGERLPHLNVYSWELMHQSAEVVMGEEDVEEEEVSRYSDLVKERRRYRRRDWAARRRREDEHAEQRWVLYSAVPGTGTTRRGQ
jgi:hypothetical protein